MPVSKQQLGDSLAQNYPIGQEGGITANTQRGHLGLVNTALGELQDDIIAINARLDAAIEKITTPEQKATINAISAEMGGAPGLILRVLANDAKHSFTTQDAATLAEVAARHNRSEEDILQLIADSPITPAESAKFLAVQTDIDAINNRLDELPTPEGIPQELYDRITALETHLEFLPSERLQIVANMNKSAENAQSILTLIDNLAAANLRIDENAALRRILPQEIADIAALKARVNITPEQADKIAAADAIHADHEARIAKLEGDDAGNGLSQDEVDARIDRQLNFDIFESVVGSTAEVRPGTTYTGNKGYQNDNGDDIPQTPPTTVTFTIPTSGPTVSDDINALNDGDSIRLTGNFNPNQRYVSGSLTETRVVVTQGDKTIETIANHPPNGGRVILDGKKGPDLTVQMTFTWRGLSAIMEPEIGGMDVSFIGEMYHDMDNFVNARIEKVTDPIQSAVTALGADLTTVQGTAQTNQQGLTAVKKTVAVLGAKHTSALDALGSGTVSQVDNQVLTATDTPFTKALHENPSQFNEGLVNLTDGSLTIGDVVLAEVKNGGLFFNLHDAGSPATSNVVPQYIGRSTGESNPVAVHLNSDSTITLTNNLPPAGSPVRIFVEADVNELDVEDEELDLVATVGQTVTHEVVHLGTTVTLTATWQANGLLIHTVRSDNNNLAVNGGRLLVNPVWQQTVQTDKVDPSDTLTRIGDHHGNAALFIHAVGGVYHIDYSGGNFETNTAHTSSTVITTALPWVITVDSNFPANMHDLQAQADANNEFLGLWYYVNHPSQVVTLPFGLATTNPDGSTTPVGGGGDSLGKVARIILGEAPAVLEEGVIYGGVIANGHIIIPELTLAKGEVRRIIGYGAMVMTKCTSSTVINIGLGEIDGTPLDVTDAAINLNVGDDTDVGARLSLGRDTGRELYFILSNVNTISAECQIELAVKFIKEQLFP